VPPSTQVTLLAELTQLVGSAREARWILEEVGCPTGLAGSGGPPVPDDLFEAQAAAARAMAARRRSGEPLQYIFGHWPFRSLDLLVDPRVLIPRPETEQVVEAALAELALSARHPTRVVDLGTGSGAIALSVAVEVAADHPDLEVWGTDVDHDALSVARSNLDRVVAGRPDLAGTVHLSPGDWWTAVPVELSGRIDLVVSNPPYVAEDEWSTLPPEVRCEPRGALLAAPASDGTPGLAGVEAVLEEAAEHLAPHGAVVIELAPPQAPAAQSLARSLGFGQVRVAPDLAGRPRALVARR
jgi:release factor glutamine methyltransferase